LLRKDKLHNFTFIM